MCGGGQGCSNPSELWATSRAQSAPVPYLSLDPPLPSQVHDPASAGGSVGLGAHLGADLAGLTVEGAAFSMIDGGAYDPDKAYKVSATRV